MLKPKDSTSNGWYCVKNIDAKYLELYKEHFEMLKPNCFGPNVWSRVKNIHA